MRKLRNRQKRKIRQRERRARYLQRWQNPIAVLYFAPMGTPMPSATDEKWPDGWVEYGRVLA